MNSDRLVEYLQQAEPLEEVASLMLSLDQQPHLYLQHYQTKLDQFAAMVDPAKFSACSEAEKIAVLAELIHETLGFAAPNQLTEDVRHHYLHDTLDRREGAAIPLSVIWIAIGRRLGLTVKGIGTPYDFVVRLERGGVFYFVDPLRGGHLLSDEQVEQLLSPFAGKTLTLKPNQLAPCSPKDVVIRSLRSLHEFCQDRYDHLRGMLVCDRLIQLTGDTHLRRDRGLHALRANALSVALDDLQAYVAEYDTAADVAEVDQIIAQLLIRTANQS